MPRRAVMLIQLLQAETNKQTNKNKLINNNNNNNYKGVGQQCLALDFGHFTFVNHTMKNSIITSFFQNINAEQ